jgi:hypothetical protein
MISDEKRGDIPGNPGIWWLCDLGNYLANDIHLHHLEVSDENGIAVTYFAFIQLQLQLQLHNNRLISFFDVFSIQETIHRRCQDGLSSRDKMYRAIFRGSSCATPNTLDFRRPAVDKSNVFLLAS